MKSTKEFESDYGKYEATLIIEETPKGEHVSIDTKSKLGYNCVFNETYVNFNPLTVIDNMIEQRLEPEAISFRRDLYEYAGSVLASDGEANFEVVVADVKELENGARFYTLILPDDIYEDDLVFNAIVFDNGTLTPWDWQVGPIEPSEIENIEWRDWDGFKCVMLDGYPRSPQL